MLSPAETLTPDVSYPTLGVQLGAVVLQRVAETGSPAPHYRQPVTPQTPEVPAATTVPAAAPVRVFKVGSAYYDVDSRQPLRHSAVVAAREAGLLQQEAAPQD